MKVKTIRTELPPICLLLHLSFWSVALSKHPSPPGTHRLPVLLIRPPSKTQNFPVAARRAAHAMWWQENLWVFQTFHVIVKSQHLQFGWNPVMSIHIRTCWLRAFWGQFSSAAQSCPTLCDPMDCSTPGLPVHHQLPELAQMHIHLRSDVRMSIVGDVEKGGCCPQGVWLESPVCRTLAVLLLQVGRQPDGVSLREGLSLFRFFPRVRSAPRTQHTVGLRHLWLLPFPLLPTPVWGALGHHAWEAVCHHR